MQKLKDFLSISLDYIEHALFLEVIPEDNCLIREITDFDAENFNESKYQLFEGHYYEYEFIGTNSNNYRLESHAPNIIIPSKRSCSRGRLSPNFYVGRLQVFIVNDETNTKYPISFEVLATKFNKLEDKSYRENYRQMLEDITDKCTDLIMQINTPISQSVSIDYSTDNRTLYQRFCFVKSFLDTSDFEEAVLRIIANPSTTWRKQETPIKVSQVKRIDRLTSKQLIQSSKRIEFSSTNPLKQLGINSIPSHIQSNTRIESLDTHENRFIKHVLQVFLNFIESCQTIFAKIKLLKYAENESKLLFKKINSYLSHPFFNQVSEANILKLNSPLLQKRSGYREVLNRWLQFSLASKLVWAGGEDVYASGKRDIATLYEYWLFFQLYDLIVKKFRLYDDKFRNLSHLFELDEYGISLKLKSGKELTIQGKTDFESRNLSVRFSYNRTFKGENKYTDEKPGSISTSLRPDYTLSIWPSSFSEIEAEREDIIVHIHFDAKYKIQNIQEQYTNSDNYEDLDKIDYEERKGTFKNVDLLKMHAYKDAIRRTGGAYILYPGRVTKYFNGFHEVLPGLGAFTINPSPKALNSGMVQLSDFLDEVVNHLLNRTTQRERILNTANSILKEPIQHYDRTLRPLSPELEKSKIDVLQTYVIVGYARSNQHMEWYMENRLYNFRMNDSEGSIQLTASIVAAKYLLIREHGKEVVSRLFKITSSGPKVLSSEKLIQMGYPNPSNPDYLAVEIELCDDLGDFALLYKELEEYQALSGSKYFKAGSPFVITFDKLLR